ncbi:MAG: hypothetical protein IJ261_00310, partial [Clostridia bacterium]|nr:hypothetical protein [Clostridia bacterium]
MKKKLLLAIPAFLILLLFLAFFKGGDSLTLFQKIQTDQFLASNPFVDEESGEIIHTVHVAAANNSENTAQDSFLEFRNRYDSAASYVELNISFGKDGVAYLADS